MADAADPQDATAADGVLLGFDVDCGEVVPGRHLHLRGLRDEGHWPDRYGNRLPDGVPGSWQMVSLAWEVVPAVRRDDPDAARWYQHDVAEVRYGVVPPLTWDLRSASGVGGGTVDTSPERPGSRGTYGPYPLPAGAREVSFTLLPYLDRRAGGEDDGGASSVVTSSRHPAGRVVVDLAARTATWQPAAGA